MNSYLKLAKYCFDDDKCNVHLSIEINELICSYCTWEAYESQYINYKYCNEIGVTRITILRLFEKFYQEEETIEN